MQHVSSSLTLLLKYGITTGYIVFFGAMTTAFWFVDGINVVAGLPIGIFRIGFTIFFILMILFLYWAVMRLKRVEMDEHFFYVTNYYKNVRYPYHQIEKVKEKDYYLFRSVHIYLKQAATFGKKISFIASRDRFNEFLKEHPEVIKQLKGLEE